MVLTVEDGSMFHVGDVLYGIPYHVCPTVALHDQSAVVENHRIVKYWGDLPETEELQFSAGTILPWLMIQGHPYLLTSFWLGVVL